MRVLVVAVAVALTACSHGGPPPKPGFGVVIDQTGWLVATAEKTTRLPSFQGNDYVHVGWNHIGWAEVSPGKMALIGNETLALVTAEGEQKATDCAFCSSVGAYGEHLFATRANGGAALGFDIVEFDDQLREIASTSMQRFAGPSNGLPNEDLSAPKVIRISEDDVVVAYVASNGTARGGPDVIAKYSRAGALLDHVVVDGRTTLQTVSPNRQYVALAAYGSAAMRAIRTHGCGFSISRQCENSTPNLTCRQPTRPPRSRGSTSTNCAGVGTP